MILSVNKGVLVVAPENTDITQNPSYNNNDINGNIDNNNNNNGDEKTEKKKLRFLISGPNSYGKEIQFLFNSLYSLGHSVSTTNSSQETVFKGTDYFTDLKSGNSETQFDCFLISFYFPGDVSGLQITRNIRNLETVKNISSIPIFIFSKVPSNFIVPSFFYLFIYFCEMLYSVAVCVTILLSNMF